MKSVATSLLFACSLSDGHAAPNGTFMQDPPRVKIPNGISWSNMAWPGSTDEYSSYSFTEVDLFNDHGKIASLKKNGHIVFCYFSIGTLEGNDNMRPDGECKLKDGKVESCKKNEALWKELAAGKMGGWDELWLDITNSKLKDIMGKRIELAATYGCHGVEPDNIDCSQNKPCKGNGRTDDVQMAFNRWTAEKAHSLGLSIALKNAGDFVKDTHDVYDCAIVEECFQDGVWCNQFKVFKDNDQAILGQEYKTKNECSNAKQYGMSLNYCDGKGDDDCDSDVKMKHCVSKPSSFTKIQCTYGYYDSVTHSCKASGPSPPAPSPTPTPPTPSPSPTPPAPPAPPTPTGSFCKTGILSDQKSVCCAASCGRCGGSDCNELPGGSHKCCVGTIHDDGQMCAKETDEACNMPTVAESVFEIV